MIENAEQKSLDWFRCRLGNITGSNAGLLMKVEEATCSAILPRITFSKLQQNGQ